MLSSLENINNQIKKAQDVVYQTMKDWLDDSIMKQIDKAKLHDGLNDGLYEIKDTDAEDVQKYKAILNIFVTMQTLTGNPSPGEIISTSLILLFNIRKLKLNNSSELTSYFSEAFEQYPALVGVFEQGFELAQSYFTKIKQTTTVEERSNVGYLTQAIAQLKGVAQHGVDATNIPVSSTLGVVSNAVADHYQSVTGVDSARTPYQFERDNGLYVINQNDPKIINTFKNSFNTLFEVNKILQGKRKLRKINDVLKMAKLLKQSLKAMEIYNSLDLTQFNDFQAEYKKGLLEIIKANLINMGPILQEVMANLEVFEVDFSVKEGSLLALLQPLIDQYEKALDNLGVPEHEKQFDANRARESRLENHQQRLKNKIKDKTDQYEVILKVRKCLEEADSSPQNLLYLRDNIEVLGLPKDLEKTYRYSIKEAILSRIKITNDLIPEAKAGLTVLDGLALLPYKQLQFLQENMLLVDLDKNIYDSFMTRISDILTERRVVLNEGYQKFTTDKVQFFAGLSDVQLQVYKDNTELLVVDDETSRNKFKATIEEEIAAREAKKQGWGSYIGSYVLQKLKDASTIGYNAVKSATDAIIYVTGTSSLNTVAKHAEVQLHAVTSQLNTLKQRDVMAQNHLNNLRYDGIEALFNNYQGVSEKVVTEKNKSAASGNDETAASGNDETVASANDETVAAASASDETVAADSVNGESSGLAIDASNNQSASVTESISFKKQAAATIVATLTSARDTLVRNLENILDPVIYKQIISSEREDHYYNVHADDSKLVKNYKALLNIVSCLAELSQERSLSTARLLVKNLKYLDFQAAGQLSKQYTNYSHSVSEQFNLLFENSPEIRALYNNTLASLQTQFAMGQAIYNIFMPSKVEEQTPVKTEETEEEVEKASLMQQVQSGFNFLKNLTQSDEADNNTPGDNNAIEVEIIEPEISYNYSTPIDIEDHPSEESPAEIENYYQGFIRYIEAIEEKTAYIQDVLHDALDGDAANNLIADVDGYYKPREGETEYNQNILAILNSLYALDKVFAESKKALNNPYSLKAFNKALKIVHRLSRVVQELNKVSLQGTQKQLASDLIKSLGEILSAANSPLQQLVCAMDKIELDYGLKPESLLSIVTPAITAYQAACKDLNVQFTDEEFPYTKARTAALETEKQRIASEIKQLETEQTELKDIIKILENLQSSSFDKIDAASLLKLSKNLHKLKLQPKTEKSYRENLNMVLMSRTEAVEVIKKNATQIGIEIVSMDDLKKFKDELPLLELSEDAKKEMSDFIDAAIQRKNDETAEEAQTVAGWLRVALRATEILDRATEILDPSKISQQAVTFVKGVGTMVMNKLSMTDQGQVVTQANAQAQALLAEINGLREQEEMMAKRIQSGVTATTNIVDLNGVAEVVQAPAMAQASGMDTASISHAIMNEPTIDAKEFVANPRDPIVSPRVPVNQPHSNEDKVKKTKEQELVDELNNFISKLLPRLFEKKAAIVSRALKYKSINAQSKGLKSKILKYRHERRKVKFDNIQESIDIIKELKEILEDDKTNAIQKLNKFDESYKPSKRLPASSNSIILELLQKSGRYLLRKINLFQPPQQKLYKRFIQKAKKEKILVKNADQESKVKLTPAG